MQFEEGVLADVLHAGPGLAVLLEALDHKVAKLGGELVAGQLGRRLQSTQKSSGWEGARVMSDDTPRCIDIYRKPLFPYVIDIMGFASGPVPQYRGRAEHPI